MMTKGAIIISFKIVMVITTGGVYEECGMFPTTTWYFSADFFVSIQNDVTSFEDKNSDVVMRRGQC